MFKTELELKQFILWAKDHGIKRIKAKGLEVEISDLAIASTLYPKDESSFEKPIKAKEETDSIKSMLDTMPSEDDDDLLYASAE